MAKAFEYPKSKYCLMLGDDDFLLKNSIDTIINNIEHIDVDFVILNANFYSLDNKVQRRLLDLNCDEYITDPIKGFENYADKMPYGCLICNLESIKKLKIEKIYRYTGTSHLYSGVLWDMLINKKCCNKAFLISKPTIGFRGEGEKTWKEDLIDIYFKQIPLWSKKLPSDYRKIANNSLSNYYKNTFNFKFLITMLQSIEFNQRNYNMPKYIRNRIKLILFFPVSFRNRLYNIYKSIKNTK